MKKIFLFSFLLISFISSKDYGWSTTRFEYWWNSTFNTMQYRVPINFIPYKIKIGKFYYGGNDYIKQVIGNGLNDTLQTNPFIVNNGEEFNYINNNLKHREGITLDIDFMSYNVLKNVQNVIDMHLGLNYKYSKVINKPFVDSDWIDGNTETIYLRPAFQSLGAKMNFSHQWHPNFYQYIFFSYSYVEGNLFETINGSTLIDGQGTEQGLGLGFNLIAPLKNKNYNLHYGLEIVFNKLNIDDIVDLEGHITNMNSENIALNFSVGIGYGGEQSIGDIGYNNMINQNYIAAIENFEYFINDNPWHPKISDAKEMIDYSNSKMAYEMYYNAIISYNAGDLENAITLFNKAILNADDNLIYEIQLKKYIIAEELLNNFKFKKSIEESIEYLKYIKTISDKVYDRANCKIADLLYDKSVVLINNKNYMSAYETLLEAKNSCLDNKYIYGGKINFLVSQLISDINNLIQGKEYIKAYGHTLFLDSIYTNIEVDLSKNIIDLKNLISIEKDDKIRVLTQEILNHIKRDFKPIDDNTFIKEGDSYNKVIELLGEPNDLTLKQHAGDNYSMLTYIFANNKYRFYFKNNKLFELEEL